LKGIGARNISDAKKFGDEFKMEKVYGSYDELFADKDINIVYIGTINTTHKENSVKALNAGKHVLCEKPMAMNKKGQEEVFEAAKRNGVFFMDGLWTRFLPSIEFLKQQIANNEIGKIKYFSSSIFIPMNENTYNKSVELGGSAIFHIGVYPIQFACLLMDHEEPTKITATGHLSENGVDQSSSITLLYSNGRIAQLNISSSTNFRYGPTYILGETGTIEIPDIDSRCPTELIIKGQLYKFDIPEVPKTNYPKTIGLKYEAEAVRQAISNGLLEHPNATFDHSRLVMKIMCEATKQIGFDTDKL